MTALLSIPECHVHRPDDYATQRPEATAWVETHAHGITRWVPDLGDRMAHVAGALGCNWRLLACRAELEQGAFSYAWDGSRPVASYETEEIQRLILTAWSEAYGLKVRGISPSDLARLAFLLGVDKPGPTPRPDGWFGPTLQMAGCAARFKYLYHGTPIPRGVLALPPLPKALAGGLAPSRDARTVDAPQGFRAGAPVTRTQADESGRVRPITIIPANQASADGLRYTSSMVAQYRLRRIGLQWFPEDFEQEERPVADIAGIKTVVIDPGHGSKGDTGTAGGGVLEEVVTLKVGLALQRILTALGHVVHMTRRTKLDTPFGVTERGKWAAAKKANVFVSIHFDGNSNSSFRGCHGFYHRETATKGKALATALATAVSAETGFPYSYGGPASTWDNDGDGQPNSLGVLAGGDNWRVTDAAALVECGTMTNPTECAVILSAAFPARCAMALARGIYAYGQVPFPEERARAALGGSYIPTTPTEPEAPAPSGPLDPELQAELDGYVDTLKALGVTDGQNLLAATTRWMSLLMLGRYDTARVAPVAAELARLAAHMAEARTQIATLQAQVTALERRRPFSWLFR